MTQLQGNIKTCHLFYYTIFFFNNKYEILQRNYLGVLSHTNTIVNNCGFMVGKNAQGAMIGALVGIVISIILWFSWGKDNSY